MTFRQMLALVVAASPAILCSCACERKASATPRQAKAAAPQQETTTTTAPTTGTSEWTTVAGSTSDAPSVTDNPENIVVRRGEAGNIEAEGAMLDGKQHGVWTFYWPNGNLKGKGAFDQGVRTGPDVLGRGRVQGHGRRLHRRKARRRVGALVPQRRPQGRADLPRWQDARPHAHLG
ncbi:MAG: hypothetical protein R3B46_12435 [Phycisphaerales bacterium]